MDRKAVKARLMAGAVAFGAVASQSAYAQTAPAAEATVAPAAAPAPAAPPAEGDLPKNTGGIVVVGNRYQATSLQMRSNNTVNVLSAADLAHTAVHNVAEALGLLPGINVMNTGSAFAGGADGASRGEGMFVSVRGLNAEYNVNLINGVEVAQGNPYSRGVQLSLLPPSGLQTIVLNKTSRADMDGDAIGGTVDFHTPSAFDYSGDTTASITGGGRLESRARAYGRSGLGFNVAGDVSHKFGRDGQFGIYVSGFYDIRHYANSLIGGVQEATCCDFGTDFAVQGPGPADNPGQANSAPGLDPAKNLILTGANYGVSEGYTRRFGGNASFDWHGDDGTTFYVRGTYAKAITQQNSHLTQIVAQNKQDGSTGTPIGPNLYAPILGNVSTRFWYETNPEVATLGTVQAGGEHKFGKLSIAPNVFYSWGENARPDHIEVAARIQNPGTPYGQSSLFTYDHNYPVPTLTPDMLASIQDIPGMPATGGNPEYTPQTSTQKKVGAKVDLQYDVSDDGVLRYIRFGGKMVDSHRMITNRDYTVPNYGGAATFGDLGIINGRFNPIFPGRGYPWSAPNIDQGALFDLFDKLGGATDATIDTCGSNPINSYNCNTQKAKEDVTAGYIMADFQVGNLEIIPGFRYEHTDIYNVFWVTPVDDDGNALTGHFGTNHAIFNKALPSIFANYRPNSRSVYRAAVWTSYVRPPFLQLGGGSNTNITHNGDITVVTVTQGNPNLKPVTALNFDASGEWDFGRGTHLMLAGFYKKLHHYIYDAGSSLGNLNPSGTEGTITNAPSNGGSGKVYGIEIQARQKFSFLKAPFDGLGVAGNFTRQWTKVDPFHDPARVDRIQNAPNYMANASIFYEKGPVTLELNYDYTGSYIANYDQLSQKATWDDLWVRPVGKLDLHAGYEFNNHLKVDLSVSNMLNTETYWSHIGRHSLAVSDIVNSGTTSLLTATIKL
jgi:TonB-dependent receptor